MPDRSANDHSPHPTPGERITALEDRLGDLVDRLADLRSLVLAVSKKPAHEYADCDGMCVFHAPSEYWIGLHREERLAAEALAEAADRLTKTIDRLDRLDR